MKFRKFCSILSLATSGSERVYRSLYVSGKLPTYSSPKPAFCPKREASVNVDLGAG